MRELLSLSILAEATSTDTPFTGEDFLNKLFPNFWSFLINFLALIVLFVAVYYIAYKPLKKYIAARKDYVEHNLRDSEQAKAIYDKKAAESDQLIVAAKQEAATIIEKAKADATVSASQIVSEAAKTALERQQAADAAIAQAEEKSKRAIHDEIVSVALEATKQVLGREVNEKDNAKLVNDFADAVSKEKASHE